MRRLTLALVIGALMLGASLWQSHHGALAQGRTPAGTGHQGDAFRFNKVAEGVYHVVGTGALTVVGNGAVIVNDDDVVIVDDHVSPAAAWVLLEEVKKLTPKPVRYVINTHFHFDHAHGNQVFGAGVDIIGSEFTRQMLAGGKTLQMPLYKNYLDGLPAQIDTLRSAWPTRRTPRPRPGCRCSSRRPRTTSPRRKS
jgi:glyoxylase-like metal-dependent hydrolase (beta-lactamase superfamily II)